MRITLKRWRSFILRALVTVGILTALMLWLDPGRLLQTMAQTGLPLWLTVVLTALLCHVVTALKWRMLLRSTGLHATVFEILRAHGAGLFANVWLPSLVGGDVIRAGMISNKRRGLGAVVTSLIADRFSDSSGLLILAAIGAAAVPAVMTGPAKYILWVTAAILVFGVVGSTVAVRYFTFENVPGRMGKAFRKMHQAAEAMMDQGRVVILAFLLSLGIQALFVGLAVPIGGALGIGVPVAVWFAVLPLAKLASLLPISLGGLGVRETALVALLSPFGVDPTLAVAHSLVWQTVLFAVGLIAGSLSLAARRRLAAAGNSSSVEA